MKDREIDRVETVRVGRIKLFFTVQRQQIDQNRLELAHVLSVGDQLFVRLFKPAEKVQIGDDDRCHVENNRDDKMSVPVPRHHVFVHRRVGNKRLIVRMPDIQTRYDGTDHTNRIHPVDDAHCGCHTFDLFISLFHIDLLKYCKKYLLCKQQALYLWYRRREPHTRYRGQNCGWYG